MTKPPPKQNNLLTSKYQPVKDATELLERIKPYTKNKILVALSGGKDSLAVLHLCVKVFGAENTEAYFMYMAPGMEVNERLIKPARDYGVKVYQYPHWFNTHYYRAGKFCALTTQGLRLRDLKLGDIEREVRKDSGIQWIAYGQRKEDSLERRAMLTQCSNRHFGSLRLYPLADWKKADVYSYMRRNRIPLPPRFGSTKSTSGLGFSEPDSIVWLSQHYPNDFKILCNYYPEAEVLVKHQQLLARIEADRAAQALSEEE